MMLDFVYRLNSTLHELPEGSRKSLAEISKETDTSIPHCLQFLTEGLDKEIELTTHFTNDELSLAIDNLTQKLHPQIEARQKELRKKQDQAVKAYERLMEKTRVQLVQKSWHVAFRSLSYFAGQHEEELPTDLLITICSDIVRYGIKAETSIQEIGRWLEKAVFCAMSRQNKAGMEEALDLIDAYGEHFLSEPSGKGGLLLGNMLGILEEPAARYELWTQYKELIDNLYPID